MTETEKMESKGLENNVSNAIRHCLFLAEDVTERNEFALAFNYLALAKAEFKNLSQHLHHEGISFYGALIDENGKYCEKKYCSNKEQLSSAGGIT